MKTLSNIILATLIIGLIPLSSAISREETKPDIAKTDDEITELLTKLKSVKIGMSYSEVISIYGPPDRVYTGAGKKYDAPTYKWISYYFFCNNLQSGGEIPKGLDFKFDSNNRLLSVTYTITDKYYIGGDGKVWWNTK